MWKYKNSLNKIPSNYGLGFKYMQQSVRVERHARFLCLMEYAFIFPYPIQYNFLYLPTSSIPALALLVSLIGKTVKDNGQFSEAWRI